MVMEMSTAVNNSNKPPNYSEKSKYSEEAYLSAMKRHENEIGNAMVGKRNAQRFACAMSFVAIMSLGLNFYQASLPAYMPVIVQTDNTTGAVIGSPIMMETPGSQMIKKSNILFGRLFRRRGKYRLTLLCIKQTGIMLINSWQAAQQVS